MSNEKNGAVSPVIGILLMLVVTIIIAAIVSAFAGGFTSQESKTPQASFAVKVSIENITGTKDSSNTFTYPDGFTVKNGIQFEHKGGDSISLDDITVGLENQGVTALISGNEKLPSSSCLPKDITNGGFFTKIGSSTTDRIIEPGDKFMLYADNCYIDKGTKYLWWTLPNGRAYGVINSQYKYSLIDRKSGKTISSGSFILK